MLSDLAFLIFWFLVGAVAWGLAFAALFICAIVVSRPLARAVEMIRRF